jgi:hypothetical protein
MKKLAVLLAIIIALALIAGCGGDAPDSNSAPTHTIVPAAASEPAATPAATSKPTVTPLPTPEPIASITVYGQNYPADLSTLDLSYRDLSDISELSALPDLETLNLSYNNISEVSALSGLTKLTSLDLRGNPLSAEQLIELRTALPECSISAVIAADIADALQEDGITVDVLGNGIDETMVEIINHTSNDYEIYVPLGTYFEANGGNVQNMVVREARTASVTAGDTYSAYIPTACMNIHRDIPYNEDGFGVAALETSSRLAKLMTVLSENDCSYYVTQAAVWIVTDNPGDYALLNTLISNGVPAIDSDELEEAKQMVALADAE